MKAEAFKIIERTLLGVIVIVFLSPLPLTMIGNSPNHFKWPLNHPWIGNHTLGGVTIEAPDVHFSWPAVASGEFQRSKASRFNDGFGGREILIRITNEVWFRLFRLPSSLASPVAVGLNDSLFERPYLREYFSDRVRKETLAPLVANLRRLQDVCRKRGMGFVVVLSPSKVSVYPEEIPREWRHRWRDPSPRARVHALELFREQGVSFVDGFSLLEAEKAAGRQNAPFFPRGATHWNSRAAWLAANAAHAQFREQGHSLGPIEVTGSAISDQPEVDDDDLVRLMNLARPWTYPCERMLIKPSAKPESEQLTMAVVGSSFAGELLRVLSASRQFSEIGFFFHYRLNKTCAVDGQLSKVRTPALPINFKSEIFAADCLLLEINEASLVVPEQHLSAFLADALAHPPDPSAGRQSFRSERYIHCEWNTEISFRAGDHHLFPERATAGFSRPEWKGTGTKGPDSIIRLCVPDAKQDIILQAHVGAAVHDPLTPKQRTSVYVNDAPVGVWEFEAGQNESPRSLVIPRRLVGEDGKIVVAFRLKEAPGLNDLLPGAETLQDAGLGLRFLSMRLSQLKDATAQN